METLFQMFIILILNKRALVMGHSRRISAALWTNPWKPCAERNPKGIMNNAKLVIFGIWIVF